MLLQQCEVEGRRLVGRRARGQCAPHLLAPVLERKRRGVHRQHIQPLGAEQRPGQRELIVDLVGGVGVDDDPRAPLRRRQALLDPGGRACHQGRGGMFKPRTLTPLGVGSE